MIPWIAQPLDERVQIMLHAIIGSKATKKEFVRHYFIRHDNKLESELYQSSYIHRRLTRDIQLAFSDRIETSSVLAFSRAVGKFSGFLPPA